MTDPEKLAAECLRTLDALRDTALAAQHMNTTTPNEQGRIPQGLRDAFLAYAAWSPERVLLLVGDDGLLRQQAQGALDGLADHLPIRLTNTARSWQVCQRHALSEVPYPCPDAERYLAGLARLRGVLREMLEESS